VSLQDQELRNKSHLIVGLTLLRRSSGRVQEISKLNFVELAGSEQAVAEETFHKDTSVKHFVTTSFNSLSSRIVRAAL